MNAINEKIVRTKRLELLRNYFHSFLRGDCLPISTCSLLLKNINFSQYFLLNILLFIKIY